MGGNSGLRDLDDRLERAERQLQALAAEVAEIRTLAQPLRVESVVGVVDRVPTVAAAWRALERGRDLEALEHAEAVLAQGTPAAVAELEAFVDAASRSTLPSQFPARFAALRRGVRPSPPPGDPAGTSGRPGRASAVPSRRAVAPPRLGGA